MNSPLDSSEPIEPDDLVLGELPAQKPSPVPVPGVVRISADELQAAPEIQFNAAEPLDEANADDSPDSSFPPAIRWLTVLQDKPGPGFLESLAWMVAFIALQLMYAFPLLIGIMLYEGITPGPRMQHQMEEMLNRHMMLVVAVPLALTWLTLIPAGWYRQGPKTGLKLNFSAPHIAHVLLALSMVIPLGFVADQLFHISEAAMEEAVGDQLNGLKEGTDVRIALEGMKDLHLTLLILIVAVCPAIGEEFLFRGLIGRGLINRYGVAFGVTVTSIFFACIHLYPPHVIAILPVGFVIHLVYLNSRSYWLPMLFHFANNSIAVLALKYSESGDSVQENPWWAAVLGGLYVIAALLLMYRIRTQYFEPNDADSPEDNEFSPHPIPVRGAEAPPSRFGFRRGISWEAAHGDNPGWCQWTIAGAGCGAVGLLAGIAILVLPLIDM